MKLNRLELAGIVASIILVALAAVFALTQTIAHADVDPCDLPGMGILGCDDNQGDMGVPVDPCDITPCGNDEPSLGEEITCEVYQELMAQGEPIPQGFDASQCTTDDGGNGGGDGGGATAACADGVDNDADGFVDMADPGCTDASDTDETDAGGGGGGSSPPACNDLSDNDGDGLTDMADPGCTDANDTDETDSSGGGSGGGGGGGGSGGSVAGSATTTCDMYLTAFIKAGQKNDPEQVKRLQHVLKTYEGANIDENGEYDAGTLSAVHAFQSKYWDTILAPWNIKQSTGYVYLTTRKKVNEIYCKNEVMFPLTADENKLIEATKKPHAATTVKPVAKPAAKPVAEPKKNEGTQKETTPATTQGSMKRSGWGTVGDFFRRLFNRGR